MKYFITAIDTDSGKTVVSAALALALEADYWKPVQAGFPTDSETVQRLTGGKVIVHKERFLLGTPASPHYAAQVDGVKIALEDFDLPKTENDLIIEGAGGCLVPLNDSQYVIDMAVYLQATVILVSNNYLGSINHTLLTLHYLKQHQIPLAGIIFNGTPNPSTEEIIMQQSPVPCIGTAGRLDRIDEVAVRALGMKLKNGIDELDKKG